MDIYIYIYIYQLHVLTALNLKYQWPFLRSAEIKELITRGALTSCSFNADKFIFVWLERN